jgi:glycerol uptake facilitator-like aquaporin
MDAVVAPPRNLWKIIGIALAIAVLLLILAGALLAYSERHSVQGFTVSTTRNMIRQFATIAANTISAAMLLGATLALTEAARSADNRNALRPWFVLVFAAGIVIVLACVAQIWNIATSDTSTGSIGFSQSLDWNEKLSQLLPYVAAGLLALTALVFANLRAPISESPEIEATPPG